MNTNTNTNMNMNMNTNLNNEYKLVQFLYFIYFSSLFSFVGGLAKLEIVLIIYVAKQGLLCRLRNISLNGAMVF